jgi:uncharacterized protein YxeA
VNIKKIISIILIILLVIVGMMACKEENDDASNDYDQSQYDDEDDSDLSGDEGENEGDDEDEDKSSEETKTFSLNDVAITVEFAQRVYTAMEEHSFESYRSIDTEKWKALSGEDKHQMYEAYLGMLEDLGFSVNTKDEQWLEHMDEDVDFYYGYLVWGFAFKNLGLEEYNGVNGDEILVRLYTYISGIEAGKYEPLHPEIFDIADDMTVEHYVSQYLLCVGGMHNVAQLTKAWTKAESWFTQTGTITPISTGDSFKDKKITYSFDGSEGKFTDAILDETDYMDVLIALAAISEDGTMLNDQIQISTKNVFDARKIFFLTQDDSGLISFAILTYDENQVKYVWDGKIINTSERTCFDNDSNFCYIDENGILQKIPMK